MRSFISRYIRPLYLRRRLFIILSVISFLFVLSFFLLYMVMIPRLLLTGLAVALVADYFLLFSHNGIFARRTTGERLSNGDQNTISIFLESSYNFPVKLGVIDELPHQFQKRDSWFETSLAPAEIKQWDYSLRPVKRGEYSFGAVNVYAYTMVGLLMRRYRFDQGKNVPVYPSFLQMRKYQLLAISNRLSEIGVKKIRRIGHSMEFEQIRDYVKGDDIRTMNWKATARRNQLMVNAYTDEKSQQVYCLIDKSRVMRMPFNGMSLLDHAINASLVLSNTALIKQDKAGIINFAEDIAGFVPAARTQTQMNVILDHLYRQRTRYLESDYEKLYSLIRNKVNQRSLLVLFTNFESLSSLQRQMKFLRKLSQQHLLLVVFFENSGLFDMIKKPAHNIEEIYTKTIAEKFAFEKKMIVKELVQYGIISLLTAPENLTINTVNKYLEVKARQLL